MARSVLALAALLVLAGCSSGPTHDSAESSSARTPASHPAAQPGPGAPAVSSAGTASSAVPSAPSIARNGLVSKSTYTDAGGVWPLTVKDGALSCEFGTQVLFHTSDGTVYAVNAAAQSAEEWENIGHIRADDPQHPGHKLPLDDLIASGTALC